MHGRLPPAANYQCAGIPAPAAHKVIQFRSASLAVDLRWKQAQSRRRTANPSILKDQLIIDSDQLSIEIQPGKPLRGHSEEPTAQAVKDPAGLLPYRAVAIYFHTFSNCGKSVEPWRCRVGKSLIRI